MATGVYRRLKDKNTPIADKLKLSRYVWLTDKVYLPNKQQVIIDLLTGLIVNKKRLNLSTDEVCEVWRCLSQIFQSSRLLLAHQTGQTLIIKASFCQAVCDVLQLWDGQPNHMTPLTYVLSCVHSVVDSALLRDVLIGRYDHMILLYGNLLTVANYLCVNDSAEDESTFTLLHKLSQYYKRAQGANPNQKQVLQNAIDRLLVPITVLLHQLNSREDNSLSQSLKDVITQALFQREHKEMYSAYLSKSDETKVKLINHLFTLVKSAVTRKAEFHSLPPELIQRAMLEYLPVLYRGYVTEMNTLKNAGHLLNIWLCDQLTTQLTGLATCDTVKQQCVTCLGQLLKVTQSRDIYSVSQDSVSGGEQLQFYRNLLDVLLQQRPSLQLFDCLTTLLELNHAILEPKAKAILSLCWSVDSQNEPEITEKRNDFVCDMVKTYVKLHQLHRWVEKMLTQLHSPTDVTRNARFPASLTALFGKEIQSLPPGIMLDIWTLFLTDISKHYLPSLEKDNSQLPNFLMACQMFSTFLKNIRVVEHSVRDTALGRVRQQLEVMEQTLRQLSLLVIAQSKNSEMVFGVLLLCHSFGEVKMLVESNTNNHTVVPPPVASSPLDFSLVHQYIPSDQWRRIAQQIIRRGEPKCQYILCLLEVQKLRAVCMSPEDSGTTTTALSLIENLLSHQSEIPGNVCVWDGDALSVTSDNLSVARWSVLISNLPLIIPRLSENQNLSLASYIIGTVGDATPEEKERGEMSLSSLSWELLRNPYIHEQSSLMSAIVTQIWSDVRGYAAAPGGKSKKKRKVDKGQTLLVKLFDILSEEKMNQSDLDLSVDSARTNQLEALSDCLTELTSSTSSYHWSRDRLFKSLQILHHLPIEYLSTGEQLHCLCGLYSILVTCISNSSVPPHLVTQITHLMTAMINSQTRCPFLYLVQIQKLFGWCETFADWLKTRYSYTELLEEGWRMIELIIRRVVRDFHLFRHLQGYITNVEECITEMLTSETGIGQSVEECSNLLSLISRILEEISKLLLWSNLKHGTRDLCHTIVDGLAEPCLRLIQALTRGKPSEAVLSVLFRCYTAVLGVIKNQGEQLCKLANKGCGELIECCKSSVRNKKMSSLKSALNFVNTICRSSMVSSDITSNVRRELWDGLLELLLLQQQQQKRADCKAVEAEKTCKDPSKISFSGQRCENSLTDNVKNSDQKISEAISVTMATILSTCDASEFASLIKSLEDNCRCDHLLCEPWRIHSFTMIWDQLLTCDLTEDHMTTFYKAVFQTMVQSQILMQAVMTSTNPDNFPQVAIPILRLQHRMLEFGQVLMSGQTAVLCLHGCQYGLFDRCPDWCYPELFTAIYEVLNAFLIHHTDTMLNSVPSFVNASKLLMKSIIERGDQERVSAREISGSSSCVRDLVQCAHQLDRLFTLLSSHKTELGKVVPYLVSNYVSEIQQVTLVPAIKKALVPAIYKLLDICDNHSIAQLHTVLSPGVTQLFKLLYEEYSKYYRYTGRV